MDIYFYYRSNVIVPTSTNFGSLAFESEICVRGSRESGQEAHKEKTLEFTRRKKIKLRR